jgi:hypothetical protein
MRRTILAISLETHFKNSKNTLGTLTAEYNGSTRLGGRGARRFVVEFTREGDDPTGDGGAAGRSFCDEPSLMKCR